MRKRSEASPVQSPALSPGVVKTSAELVAALAPAPSPLFVSAQPRLAPGFEAIVERVFVDDPLAEYNRLEAVLVVGEKRADYASLLKALDQAEDNARCAHRLYLSAKVDRERYEIDAQLVEAAMWEPATADLQREKDDGLRNKTITDADVRNRCAAKYTDEWRDLAVRRARVKATVEHTERLADLWKQRCHSLGTMLGTLRK